MENLLGTKFYITEIIWRTEGAPSQSICAAHEWVDIFPALLPLHLTAVLSHMFPPLVLSYHNCYMATQPARMGHLSS